MPSSTPAATTDAASTFALICLAGMPASASSRKRSNKKYGYKKETAFDFEHPIASNLPDQTHSINAGYFWNKQELAFDPNHANDAGKYLGGLIWCGILFKDSTKKIGFKPASVSDGFKNYLLEVANKVVKVSKN